MANLAATNLFNVKDQVIVITGGGTGIGLMMAKSLAHNGAHRVYILGRRLEKLQEAAQHGVDGNIVPLQCDVSSTEQLAAAAQRVKEEVGFVNVVVANTGVSGPQVSKLPEDATVEQLQSFLWEQGMQAYTDTYALNVSSVQFTLLAFLVLLSEGNKHPKSPGPSTGLWSQFIVTSSIAGFNRKPTAGFAYGSSKAAVNHLMKQMMSRLLQHQIRVNVICPGVYPSEMTAPFLSGTGASEKPGSVPFAMIPAQRLGTEEDMAGGILYLCSRAGGYVNGNYLITDGGRLSQMPSTY